MVLHFYYSYGPRALIGHTLLYLHARRRCGLLYCTLAILSTYIGSLLINLRHSMYKKIGFWGTISLLLVAAVLPQTVSAQEVHQEFQETVKAEVIEILEQFERDIMGTGATTTVQELRILIEGGARKGEVVRLDNDLVVLSVGDKIFVNRLLSIDGTEYYIFKDVERRGPLMLLVLIFVGMVVWLSGWQGVRAVFSLGLSILAILFVLVPALMAGYSPALVSLGAAAVILSLTLFLTHGFKPRVVVTFFGTMGAVTLTCVIAYVWVEWMRFTGFGDDASVYLNFATGGKLDLSGLLLGGIIIGLLGVLDDVSITQASVVQELKSANPLLGFKELYTRAMRVGKDHIGSLVNTLALAYAGAALPLILLYSFSESSMTMLINQEILAAEVVRIIVSSIGLIMAAPLTTALAAWYFKDKTVDKPPVVACGHGHHHHH